MKKTDKSSLVLEAILAEYKVRAAEIQYRSGAENTYLQIHISAITAVLTGIILIPSMAHWLIFLIPIESSLFGLWWIGNSISIFDMGAYIRENIEPKVSKLVGQKEAMHWENFLALQNKIPKKEVAVSNLIFITFSAPSFISLLITFLLIILTINSNYMLIPLQNIVKIEPIYPGVSIFIASLCFIINAYFYRFFINVYSHRGHLTKK